MLNRAYIEKISIFLVIASFILNIFYLIFLRFQKWQYCDTIGYIIILGIYVVNIFLLICIIVLKFRSPIIANYLLLIIGMVELLILLTFLEEDYFGSFPLITIIFLFFAGLLGWSHNRAIDITVQKWKKYLALILLLVLIPISLCNCFYFYIAYAITLRLVFLLTSITFLSNTGLSVSLLVFYYKKVHSGGLISIFGAFIVLILLMIFPLDYLAIIIMIILFFLLTFSGILFDSILEVQVTTRT